MCETQFTLSWESFQQNICNGLGVLQQNEDLVDMTLAADGHFVRVHKLVLSLASPYFRDLIKSAQCQNPVIFLNRISNKVLSSILEYIYTGQVVVGKEHIEELVQAAKALHIKGLMDMSYQVNLSDTAKSTMFSSSLQSTSGQKEINNYTHNSHDDLTDCADHSMDEPFDDGNDPLDRSTSQTLSNKTRDVKLKQRSDNADLTSDAVNFQYSLSNQGSLQLILNRFIYCLRYTSKSGLKQWRCTDYNKNRCRATVITKDNVVLRRTSAHVHPFHDKQIAKRVQANSIFSVISEAEEQGDSFKRKKKLEIK